MANSFSIRDILRSACGPLNPHLKELKHLPSSSSEKQWMQEQLSMWCRHHDLELRQEYRFQPRRKWRADWAIPGRKLLIEYEGLFSKKSRHTTATGFTGDTDKYNAAQALGYKVLRFTALNYRNLITELNQNL